MQLMKRRWQLLVKFDTIKIKGLHYSCYFHTVNGLVVLYVEVGRAPFSMVM